MVGTIIPQYETEEFIQEGLQKVEGWHPGWSPQFFMTDKSAQELGAQLHVDVVMYSINNQLHLIHQGLLVKLTLTASGWSVTSTLSKHLSDGLTAHSMVFHLK